MNLHSVMFEKIFLYGKLFCFNTFSFHTVKGHTDSGYLKQTLNVSREKSPRPFLIYFKSDKIND